MLAAPINPADINQIQGWVIDVLPAQNCAALAKWLNSAIFQFH